MNKILFLILMSSVSLFSCETKDPVISPGDKNEVVLEFDPYAGNEKLVLNTKTYKNVNGEDYTVSTFNFFVSNISLKKSDGTEVTFPNQYFLVRQADPSSLKITLKDVPAADYTSLKYTIGVDSLKSVSDLSQRTGVLDPASYGGDNMYWSWNSGYIFFKIEGTSPASSDPSKAFMYHVGGYGGYSGKTPNNLRVITADFGTGIATVRRDVAATVHIITDIARVFSAGLKISSVSMIHSPGAAKPVADGYVSMFKVDHIHNDKRTHED